MSRTIKLSKKFKEFDFLKFYKNNRSKKYIYRCLACHYISHGKSYKQVQSLVHYSKPSIIDWINNFEDNGINGLLSIRKGRGRRTKLADESEQEFKENIVLLQDNRCGGRITGYDIMGMLKDKFKVKYSISGTYNLLFL